MRKNDGTISWKRAVDVTLRTFRLFNKKFPKAMLSRTVYFVWSSLTPYVAVYFSALVLSEIAGNADPDRLVFLVLLSLGVAAITSLITALLKRTYEVENSAMWYKVNAIYGEKAQSIDYKELENTETASLIATVKQNESSGGWGLVRVLRCIDGLVTSFTQIIGGIALTVTLFTLKIPESAGSLTILNDPFVNIGVVILMLAITLISPIISTKARESWAKLANTHNLGNRLFSFFGFLGYRRKLAMDVRIYRQDLFCEKYNRSKEDTFSSNGAFANIAKKTAGPLVALASVVATLLNAVVYAFVCLKAIGGAFDVGGVTQYVSSITMLTGGVRYLVEILGVLKNNGSFLKLSYKYLDLPSTMQCGDKIPPKTLSENSVIEFRNVSFKYPSTNVYALKDVNFKLKLNKRLAIVGMNGSGKTTFIKLLCRLYDPTSGEILLDGVNIKEYNYEEYMRLFAVVFQDFELLALRIKDNVASQSDGDDSKVLDALEKAGFMQNLDKMPNGIDTYLYKDFDMSGVEISGGEAQKIAIARAIYKDSPLIVLDEPTAALDPLAEAEIYSNFDEIATDKTAIYISHRLSSCKFCDEIAVFDEGRIAQIGSHNELVSDENGKYFELWNAQAQYYSEG